MLIAKKVQDRSRRSLHYIIGPQGAQTCHKGICRETLSIATAAILVKIMSIFLGDPPLGKYFLYFFPDHLEGRGFHQSMPRYFAQIKVKGSKALRPIVWPPGSARVEIYDFFPTPPMFEGPGMKFPNCRKWSGWYRWTQGTWGRLAYEALSAHSHRLATVRVQSQKFTFWGENHFFSAPCVTPLGSVCGLSASTLSELSGKKNRMSLSLRIRVANRCYAGVHR